MEATDEKQTNETRKKIISLTVDDESDSSDLEFDGVLPTREVVTNLSDSPNERGIFQIQQRKSVEKSFKISIVVRNRFLGKVKRRLSFKKVFNTLERSGNGRLEVHKKKNVESC